MEVSVIIELITSLGFPIVCVGVLGFFIWRIYNDSKKQQENLMTSLQDKCQAREDKLYEEIKECREINGQAIATISKYAGKLEVVEADVKEIKEILLSNHQ